MQVQGRVVTDEGVVGARLSLDERILAIEPCEVAEDAPLILPGFIDLHVHGGGGGDVMQGVDGTRQMCAHHLRHGTTALLPTTVTARFEELELALAGIATVMQDRREGEARVLGAHLEGPYISPTRLGAQPPHARTPQRWEVDRLLDMAPVRAMTLAPEVEGCRDLIQQLGGRGVRVQIGHTNASYRQSRRSLEAGASGFTHLYNAMSGIHQRAGGAVAAALAHADFAEIILDLRHVTAGALTVALRAVPFLYGVTDAVACCGLPDGSYRLGQQTVCKRDGGVYLDDGTLAGSVLTMDAAFRNLLAVGLDPAGASRRLSSYPARYLGLDDHGRIAPGSRADLVILDPDHEVLSVLLGGEVSYERDERSD